MSALNAFLKSAMQLVLGDAQVPQEFTLGMADPQPEITVWLHGAGAPIDVTQRHSMACASPLTICVGFSAGEEPATAHLDRLSLRFCERSGQQRLLGEIGLQHQFTIPVDGATLILFATRSTKNRCLSPAKIWGHYLLYEFRQWRRDNTKGIRMSFLERRAGMVIFICPRPTILVSVGTLHDGNIFPMNIMGNLGNGYLGFGLRSERVAGTLIARASRAALCNLPLAHGSHVYALAHNHTKSSIPFDQLSFATRPSPEFRIPIPEFAQRVREVEIATVRPIGSHNFFVARVAHDETFSEGLGFCAIHGFYQLWRLRGFREQLQTSLIADQYNKRERFVP